MESTSTRRSKQTKRTVLMEKRTVKHKQKYEGDGQDARKALPQQLRASSDSFGCREQARRDAQTPKQLHFGE